MMIIFLEISEKIAKFLPIENRVSLGDKPGDDIQLFNPFP